MNYLNFFNYSNNFIKLGNGFMNMCTPHVQTYKTVLQKNDCLYNVLTIIKSHLHIKYCIIINVKLLWECNHITFASVMNHVYT